jgi:glycerol uptake facilitator-like aquaporin
MMLILLGNGVVANVVLPGPRKQFRLDRNYCRFGVVGRKRAHLNNR